jgi:hypothetical protein
VVGEEQPGGPPAAPRLAGRPWMSRGLQDHNQQTVLQPSPASPLQFPASLPLWTTRRTACKVWAPPRACRRRSSFLLLRSVSATKSLSFPPPSHSFLLSRVCLYIVNPTGPDRGEEDRLCLHSGFHPCPPARCEGQCSLDCDPSTTIREGRRDRHASRIHHLDTRSSIFCSNSWESSLFLRR